MSHRTETRTRASTFTKSMYRPARIIALACCVPFFVGLPLATDLRAQDAPAGEAKKPSGPMMRFICVKSLEEDEELIIASKTEDGEWLEHDTLRLRSSFITDWVKARSGVTMHLARRNGDKLDSICSFRLGEKMKRPVVVLLPDARKNVYVPNVIDPAKLGFKKGTSLVTNYSNVPAMVMLGNKRTQVMPGKQVAERAVAGADGMYRLLVGYQDSNKQLVPCYDRYVPANPDARDFLLLFPDTTTGLKVYSLSEFGPFE